MSTDKPIRYAAIVTAAGASERMGRPKALVTLGGLPLLLHQARVLQAEPLLDPIVAVLGSEAEAIARAVADWDTRLDLVRNPRWPEGRSSSLEVGARAVPNDVAGVLIVAVDQPLDPAVVRALLAAGPADEVLVPIHAGRRGHPVLLPGALLAELARASRHPEGLRDIVRSARTRTIEVDSPRIHLDLNTPDAVRAAETGR